MFKTEHEKLDVEITKMKAELEKAGQDESHSAKY